MKRTNSHMCRAPSKFKNLGSEVDWLNFFWGFWTQGGSNVTVQPEIHLSIL